jgi:hypothetical protein
VNKTYPVIAVTFLLVSALFLAASCGKPQEPAQITLDEAKVRAAEAIESAEILLQGAKPGTDLSDARELLDQAQAAYAKATTVEEFIGPEHSVLLLVEEAKRRARQAMEAEQL